jgi:hypothetical protein
MSANVYSIEALLEGHFYRSRSLQGEIVYAEKDNRAVWYGTNTQAFLVQVRPSNDYGYKWRTVAVSTGE